MKEYQRDSNKTAEVVYAEIMQLLASAPDLQEDFAYFLPNSYFKARATVGYPLLKAAIKIEANTTFLRNLRYEAKRSSLNQLAERLANAGCNTNCICSKLAIDALLDVANSRCGWCMVLTKRSTNS